MNPDGHVLVIGGAGLDGKGRATQPLQMQTSNPGSVRLSFGGVARNIAENLARLEVPTILLTAFGDDDAGHWLRVGCQFAGIDISHALILPGERSSSYIALLDPNGDLAVAISDYTLVRDHISAEYVNAHAALFADAAMIALDANLSEAALTAIFDQAERYAVPVCADPTSVPLAGKLCDLLGRLFMIAPNAAEVTALCGVSDAAVDTDLAI